MREDNRRIGWRGRKEGGGRWGGERSEGEIEKYCRRREGQWCEERTARRGEGGREGEGKIRKDQRGKGEGQRRDDKG